MIFVIEVDTRYVHMLGAPSARTGLTTRKPKSAGRPRRSGRTIPATRRGSSRPVRTSLRCHRSDPTAAGQLHLRDPNTPATRTGPTHRPTTDPRRPRQRIPASRLSQQRHRPNIETPQVAQADQLRPFLRSAGGRACRRFDLAARRRVRLLGLPHISLCHRAAARDQVDEHAEEWQDDDEDQQQRLTPSHRDLGWGRCR